MKNKHWLVRMLAVLLAFGLVAAACGDDDDEDTGSDDSSGEATESDLAGEEVLITGPERAEQQVGAINAALDMLEERTGMEITYTGSADWESEINTQVAGGNPPNISIFPQPGKLADFARDGILKEFSSDVVASSEAWPESWRSFGDVDGGIFGVPVSANAKSLVWYKPADFEANGYSVPESWDDFKALVDTMIADGNTPLCVGIESGQATGWVFTDWTEDLLLRFEGPEVYDDWVANDVKFADERIINVWNEILELWNTDGAVFAAGGSIAATTHSADPAEGLANDQCMMVRQASFFTGFLPAGSSDIDVFYFPSVDDTRPVLGAGALIGAFDDNPATMAVAEFMAGAEYAEIRQQEQTAILVELNEAEGVSDAPIASGFLSPAEGQDTSVYTDLEQSLLDILATADVVRFDGADLMPADVGAGTFWSEGTALVNGDTSPEDAAAAIDASWP